MEILRLARVTLLVEEHAGYASLRFCKPDGTDKRFVPVKVTPSVLARLRDEANQERRASPR